MAAELHLPHQFAGAYKTLTAQCHCKSTHFTVTVPTSALPLPVHLCHCSICRYTHGTFSCFHAPLPKEVEPHFVSPSSVESSVTGYIHDKAASERFFCTTCGCHIGDRDLKVDPETGKTPWRVATSIFDTHDEETFQIRSHCFVDPATEPNLATWLPSINGRDVHVWNPGPDDPHFPLAQSRPPKPDLPDRNHLLAQCHCGGVRFTLPRPSESDAADPLLARFLRTGPTPSPTLNSDSNPNPDHNPSPTNTTTHTAQAHHAHTPATLKRVACLCLCTDCRLVSGAHAMPWTFAPLASLQPAIPESLEGGGTTLRAYRSSEKVTRAFCGGCGASVFYLFDDPERVKVGDGGEGGEGRVVVVDVAVGLLRDWEGGSVAAEEWLAWRTGRLAGLESGRRFDGGFAEGLAEGLGRWGLRRYGRREEFEIPQDL
ncbi:Mss4-like protein [Chaetomium tenue]|uniref:Mss4-like protein n=1 Tax=Chaetomium tenue TaxID=1854479 RepID=A0ACB7P4X8_9PEZI|nr:Mss4-like protein [Chaetomium globosum]